MALNLDTPESPERLEGAARARTVARARASITCIEDALRTLRAIPEDERRGISGAEHLAAELAALVESIEPEQPAPEPTVVEVVRRAREVLLERFAGLDAEQRRELLAELDEILPYVDELSGGVQ